MKYRPRRNKASIKRRRLAHEDLEERRLLAVLVEADLSAFQSAHVSTLKAHCNTTDQTLVYYEDFEQGFGGYTADNSGGTLPGLWHHSLGRRIDGDPNHSPNANFYYGLFETGTGGGRYDTLPFDHQGVLISPAITLPAGVNTLSFNYFLNTRLPTDIDFVDVSVVDLDIPGATPVELLSRAEGSLNQTSPSWDQGCVTLPTQFSGRRVELRFRFDTGDEVNVDPEGWYVDDILITNVPPTADMSVSKTPSDSAPIVGEPISYQLNVANAPTSNAIATGVTVVDLLPAGLTFVSASDGGSFNGTTREITWDLNEIAIGGTVTLTVNATVNLDTAGQTIVNIGRVMAQEQDPDPTDNETEVPVTPVPRPSADLGVTKTVDDATPNEGQLIKYTVSVNSAQASANTATGVVVTDLLPTGVSFDSAMPSEGNYDPMTGLWDGLELAPGETETLMLFALVDAGTSGNLVTNVAEVIADQDDPDPSNNRVEQESTVNRVDLTAVKLVDNAMPEEGSQVTFTIDVTNQPDSNAVATSVVVVDTLPDGLTFRSATAGGVYDMTARTVTWDLPDIPQDSTVSVMLVASVDAGTATQTLTNIARVQADETDPDPTDNETTREVTPMEIATQTVQFIAPLGVFDATNTILPPTSGIAALGFVWHDQNGNGTWDTDELGIDGVDVDVFSGATLVASSRTVTADVNGDGVLDPNTETGVYFFPAGVFPDGDYTIRVRLPGGATPTVPGTGEYALSIDSTDPDSSRVLGVARTADSPNFGAEVDFVSSPLDGFGSIIGYAWSDIDQDGVWDFIADGNTGFSERGQAGKQFFLDLNSDGALDVETEPIAITGDDGKFVFANVPLGDYTIREVDFETGTLNNRTFPQAGFHSVSISSANRVIESTVGVAEAPSFGSFEFSPYVRPADQFAAFVDDFPELRQALSPWQSVQVRNQSGAEFSITTIDEMVAFQDPVANVSGSEFVSVKLIEADGTLSDPVLPLAVPADQILTFLVFYDPAKRTSNDHVEAQYPDWLSIDPANSFHTFASGDRIEFVSETGLRFPVDLVGGSTFDSDITHDGRVDLQDFAVLDDLLLRESVITKSTDTISGSHRFAPTLDINARCPNGADQATGTCDFPIDQMPRRELALGDFGPLNVELTTPRSERPTIDVAMPFPSGQGANSMFASQTVQVPAPEPIPSHSFDHDTTWVNDDLSCRVVASDQPSADRPLIATSQDNQDQFYGPIQVLGIRRFDAESTAAAESLSDDLPLEQGELHWCDPGPLADSADDDEEERRNQAIDAVFAGLV